MATVIGLTQAKINGIFHVDVRNSRYSVKRATTQHVTAGGIKIAVGEMIPTGSFDEVIPRTQGFAWRDLSDFSIEIYDKETRSIVIASFEGCHWSGVDGSSDLAQANASKAITWAGSRAIKF